MDKINNIRHSLAHIMALAIKRLYVDVKFGIGPVTDTGFFYDFKFPKDAPGETDLEKVEEEMKKIIKEDVEFVAKEVSADEAKEIFKDQPYKLELINDLVKYGTTDFGEIKNLKANEAKKLKANFTTHAIGEFTDLCRGGHVKRTSDIDPDSFKLIKTAGAYWRGNEKNDQLVRIYGVAFENKKELKKHLVMLEEAKKRDHRVIGKQMDLFSQHKLSPGSIFWHPKGMIIWRELEKFIREKNDAYGYGEISTPIIVKKELYEISGHWDHYRENGFWFDVDKETYVLKSMNCPESTLVYSNTPRSYRDLPLRLAEPTGKLHRNELTGTLGGLFRLRQFTQDDAHVYCRPDQIESEISSLIKYTKELYEVFGLPISFNLATKPEKAMGDLDLWEKAESDLENVLKKSGIDYKTKSKDGTFYGPKIDIHAKDAIGREHQLATIQLDFQMPERFKLEYTDEKGEKQQPVMIHRAIFGSFERFIGVLIEHFAGVFPTWLAPLQVVLLPVSEKQKKYCLEVGKKLRKERIRERIETAEETLGKRIREAEMQKVPYILVMGEKEVADGTVNVRSRKSNSQETINLDKFVFQIKKEIEERSL